LPNLIANEQYEHQQLKYDGSDGYGNMTIFELLGLDARRDDDQGGDEEFKPFVHGVWKVVTVETTRSDGMVNRTSLGP
jgi:hypothetical protein